MLFDSAVDDGQGQASIAWQGCRCRSISKPTSAPCQATPTFTH